MELVFSTKEITFPMSVMSLVYTDDSNFKGKCLNVVLNFVLFVHRSPSWVIAYTLSYFIPSFTSVYNGSLDLYIDVPKSLGFFF